MLFAANIAVVTIVLVILCSHSSDVHQHSTFNRNRTATLLWGTDFWSRPSTKLSRKKEVDPVVISCL